MTRRSRRSVGASVQLADPPSRSPGEPPGPPSDRAVADVAASHRRHSHLVGRGEPASDVEDEASVRCGRVARVHLTVLDRSFGNGEHRPPPPGRRRFGRPTDTRGRPGAPPSLTTVTGTCGVEAPSAQPTRAHAVASRAAAVASTRPADAHTRAVVGRRGMTSMVGGLAGCSAPRQPANLHTSGTGVTAALVPSAGARPTPRQRREAADARRCGREPRRRVSGA